MRLALIVGVCVGLAGCVSATGNSTGGVIDNASSSGEAMRKAEAHCATFGKIANPKNSDWLFGTMTFDCVPPPAK